MAERIKAGAEHRRQATAYHEAGHAVLHCLFRRRFRSITIEPDAGEGSLGHVSGGKFPVWFRPDVEINGRMRDFAEHEILILFAGGVAEAHWRGKHDWRGSAPDFRAAATLSIYFYQGKTEQAWLRWLSLLASDFIRSRPRWRQVEVVAKALLQKGHLSDREVRRVIKQDDEARYGRLVGLSK